MEAGEQGEAIRPATSNELGSALLRALGIDPKQVLSFSLECDAGKPAIVTLRRLAPASAGEVIPSVVESYRLEPAGARASNGFVDDGVKCPLCGVPMLVFNSLGYSNLKWLCPKCPR